MPVAYRLAQASRLASSAAARRTVRGAGHRGRLAILLGTGGCLLAKNLSGGGDGSVRCFWGVPKGRDTPLPDAPTRDAKHFVKQTSMYPPWPEGMQEAMFGMGCFWCSENLFMNKAGIYSTQVGYAGGKTPNPSYNDVCTGRTGHNEVVRVVFDPKEISYLDLLKIFWEKHDPTTPNQQGFDKGTQYRSGIYYYNDEQKKLAEATKGSYSKTLLRGGHTGGRDVCTEICPAPEFFYAEDYHQQYDAKPGSRRYCGLSPTGASLDIGPCSKL